MKKLPHSSHCLHHLESIKIIAKLHCN